MLNSTLATIGVIAPAGGSSAVLARSGKPDPFHRLRFRHIRSRKLKAIDYSSSSACTFSGKRMWMRVIFRSSASTTVK